MTPAPLAPLLHLLRSEPSRTWSIVVTIYGDAIVPRGGTLWLGTLRQIFEALEIGEGVVRTAMSRLAADGWLERRRIGRHSYYRLSDKAHAASIAAAARIYDAAPRTGGPGFTLVLAPPSDRERLLDAGFGQAAPGVWMAPSPAGVPQGAISLTAEAEPATARQLAAQAWPLDRIAADYRRFIDVFAGLSEDGPKSDLDALLIRVLMIHDYRRIALRDPRLPPVLLPRDWPGHEARDLCARLYPRLLPASEAWLDAHGRCETGPIPPADPSLGRRFQP